MIGRSSSKNAIYDCQLLSQLGASLGGGVAQFKMVHYIQDPFGLNWAVKQYALDLKFFKALK